MRPSFRAATVALVAAACVFATGCAPEPTPPRTPAPTATPLFASDEEALAAAEQAYAAYLQRVDTVLQNGGREANQLSEVAVGDALDAAMKDARDFESQGLRTVGATKLSSIRLQEYGPKYATDSIVVRVYVCEDVAEVDVIDSDGNSLVTDNRPSLTAFEVGVSQGSGRDLGAFLVAKRVLWTSSEVCK